MQPNGPRLIVEPDDGHDPVRDFISSAETSLLVKQFTFTDETLIAAVIDRKKLNPLLVVAAAGVIGYFGFV